MIVSIHPVKLYTIAPIQHVPYSTYLEHNSLIGLPSVQTLAAARGQDTPSKRP